MKNPKKYMRIAGIPASTIVALPVEDADKERRKPVHESPCHNCIQDTDHGHEYNGLLYPFILPGSVVIPQHGLGTVGQAVYRHGNNLPDRVDYGHDSHIEVSAEFLEGHGIIHDLYKTVCNRHGKSGHSQAHDAKQPAGRPASWPKAAAQ